MGLESGFQSEVLKYINSLPGCKAENVSGNASQSGRPDITGCRRGRMFKLELKSPDHAYKASTKQKLELRKWKNVGAVVGVIYSMTAVKYLFEYCIWEPNHPLYYAIEEDNGCESWFEIPEWEGKLK